MAGYLDLHEGEGKKNTSITCQILYAIKLNLDVPYVEISFVSKCEVKFYGENL